MREGLQRSVELARHGRAARVKGAGAAGVGRWAITDRDWEPREERGTTAGKTAVSKQDTSLSFLMNKEYVEVGGGTPEGADEEEERRGDARGETSEAGGGGGEEGVKPRRGSANRQA